MANPSKLRRDEADEHLDRNRSNGLAGKEEIGLVLYRGALEFDYGG
jgi:hypothetical protein